MGSSPLIELWRQIPEHRAGQNQPHSPLGQLRYLLFRLSEDWCSYRVFDKHRDLPRTNNTTERTLCRK